MNIKALLSTAILTLSMSSTAVIAGDLKVKITRDIASVDVMHNGKKVTIQRNQNNKNNVDPRFAKTSRNCPPFCINPIVLAPGVETLGEVEVLDYLKRMSDGDSSILVIDSRTPNWVKAGTIPGAKNIPWTKLSVKKGADPLSIAEIVTEEFNGKELDDDKFDYSNAKTLVMFCNGMWCGQSPNNIRTLLKMGYPANKIKWYRGGMQNWENLGFTTVK
ncbi:MAG: sulfurtransferase [endosymbiont of Galathealinum brachiosum]|uniref:Sulfurtransferase n=1 Tax=endosymbiont of Galathealinum brachiosum TaxID=2200906 RepID=A0A370DE87_9GAMM|nr:MAG: sulfurtransferase [endosymbiont of Galathealinum brachiosum]